MAIKSLAGQWTPNTQKAKGIRALATGRAHALTNLGATYGPVSQAATNKNSNYNLDMQIEDSQMGGPGEGTGQIVILPHMEIGTVQFPAFARPCPTRPRHGFVDSCIVNSHDTLEALLTKAQEEDPDAEVVVMPYIEARRSCLATNAGVTWGTGNSGATEGRGPLVHLPTPSKVEDWNMLVGTDVEALGIEDTLYLEYVSTWDNNSICVQMRDGPAQEAGSADFIPKSIEVKELISPRITSLSGGPFKNLLEWEKEVEEAAEREGVVMYMRQGSLSNHYAVHAIQHGIPVVTSFKPTEGDTLEPAGNEVKPLPQAAYARLADYLGYYMRRSVNEEDTNKGRFYRHREMIASAVGVLHSAHMWSYEDRFTNGRLALRAEAAATICRFVIGACIGEARYFHVKGPGEALNQEDDEPDIEAYGSLDEAFEHIGEDERRSALPWGEILDSSKLVSFRDAAASIESENAGVERSSVYSSILDLPPDRLWQYGMAAALDLAQPGWGESFGGDNWSSACHAALRLLADMAKFVKNPCEEQWRSVWKSLNMCINTVHNGGRVLTKWVSPKMFVLGEHCPGYLLASGKTGATAMSCPSAGVVKGLRRLLALPNHDPDQLEALPIRPGYDGGRVCVEVLDEDMLNEEKALLNAEKASKEAGMDDPDPDIGELLEDETPVSMEPITFVWDDNPQDFLPDGQGVAEWNKVCHKVYSKYGHNAHAQMTLGNYKLASGAIETPGKIVPHSGFGLDTTFEPYGLPEDAEPSKVEKLVKLTHKAKVKLAKDLGYKQNAWTGYHVTFSTFWKAAGYSKEEKYLYAYAGGDAPATWVKQGDSPFVHADLSNVESKFAALTEKNAGDKVTINTAADSAAKIGTDIHKDILEGKPLEKITIDEAMELPGKVHLLDCFFGHTHDATNTKEEKNDEQEG